MGDEDLRDEADVTDTSDGAARRRRIQGSIEIAMSDLEREFEIGSGELALHMLRTQMGRVQRLEGAEGYYSLVSVALDTLIEQKEGMEKIAAHDARRWAY